MGIRILLVDDHKLLREGLRSLLSAQSDMTVVAEAEDGRSAIQSAVELSPDVVVMDISMPGMNGIEATRQILKARPAIRIMALSMHPDLRMVLDMFSSGASGYLLKECAFEEVVRAVQIVAAKGVYFSPQLADALCKEYLQRLRKGELPPIAGLPEKKRALLELLENGCDLKQVASNSHISIKSAESCRRQIAADHILPHILNAGSGSASGQDLSLTQREKEILGRVRAGKNNGEISTELAITRDTVKYHMRKIFQKLSANNRSRAIAVAIENRLIEP